MSEQREAVTFLVTGGLSVPRACALMQIPRSTFRYVAQGHDDTELLAQIREGSSGLAVGVNQTLPYQESTNEFSPFFDRVGHYRF